MGNRKLVSTPNQEKKTGKKTLFWEVSEGVSSWDGNGEWDKGGNPEREGGKRRRDRGSVEYGTGKNGHTIN